MVNRSIMAVAAALFCVGSTLAQAPDGPPPVTPTLTTSATAWTAIGSFLPARSDVAPGHFWFTGDYLFTWVSGTTLPPLVTTSDAGTPRTTAYAAALSAVPIRSFK